MKLTGYNALLKTAFFKRNNKTFFFLSLRINMWLELCQKISICVKNCFSKEKEEKIEIWKARGLNWTKKQ